MTFAEIVNLIADRTGLFSPEAKARIGAEVNSHYKRVTSSLGVQVGRRVMGVEALTALGSPTVTFTNIEKIDRVIDDTDGTVRVLEEVSIDDLRKENPGTGTPKRYAIQNMVSGVVTIRLDVLAQSVQTLKADGLETAEVLSGNQEPLFSGDYHDILVERTIADECRKSEKLSLAKEADAIATRRMSELRLFIAKSGGLVVRQNKAATSGGTGSGSSGAGSAPSGGTSYTQTGQVTFATDIVLSNDAGIIGDNVWLGDEDGNKVLEIDGDSGDIVLSEDFSGLIRHDTNLGEDDQSIYLVAGGGTDLLNTRGAKIWLTGADEPTVGGRLTLQPAASGVDPNIYITRADSQNAVTIKGDTGYIHLGPNAPKILTDTEEGSDTKDLYISAAGGSAFATRGAYLHLFGNQASQPGAAALVSGTAPGSYVALFAGQTPSLTVDGTTGVVSLLLGQLAFPAVQNPSSNANTLDDYEEGSWTPVWSGLGTPGTGQVYYSQVGRYVKIGKHVTVWGRVILSTLGTLTGALTIAGLPFVVAQTVGANSIQLHHPGVVGYFSNLTTPVSGLSVLSWPLLSEAAVYAIYNASNGQNTVTTSIGQGDLSNSTDILITLSYETAA